MYENGAPEEVIQERTGHRSLEALRTYKQSNTDQHQAVSALLSAPSSSGTHVYHSKQSTSTISGQVYSSGHDAPTHVPGLSFQNLHGCTININSAPANPPQTPIMTEQQLTETEIDEIFALAETL